MNRRSLLKWLGVGSAAAAAAPVVAKVAEAAPPPVGRINLDVDEFVRLYQSQIEKQQAPPMLAYEGKPDPAGMFLRGDGCWHYSKDGVNWTRHDGIPVQLDGRIRTYRGKA